MTKMIVTLIGVAFMALTAPVKAETTTATAATDLTVAGFDLSKLFSDARAGMGLPMSGGDTALAVYRPVLYINTAAGKEIASIGPGAASLSTGTKFSGFGGLRIDTLVGEIPGVTTWTKTHITTDMPASLQFAVGPLWTEGRKLTNPQWYAFLFLGF